MSVECPFCAVESHRIVASNYLAFAIRDGYPVSPGHTLAIPNRHVESFFDLSADEQDALFDIVREQKRVLDREFCPQGFNIGINDGAAAGQTVPHVHAHLIPDIGVTPLILEAVSAGCFHGRRAIGRIKIFLGR